MDSFVVVAVVVVSAIVVVGRGSTRLEGRWDESCSELCAEINRVTCTWTEKCATVVTVCKENKQYVDAPVPID